MVSRKADPLLLQWKRKLVLKLRLIVPIDEEETFPVEVVVDDNHCLSKVGQFHHFNYL